jgi:hypothetical protein
LFVVGEFLSGPRQPLVFGFACQFFTSRVPMRRLALFPACLGPASLGVIRGLLTLRIPLPLLVLFAVVRLVPGCGCGCGDQMFSGSVDFCSAPQQLGIADSQSVQHAPYRPRQFARLTRGDLPGRTGCRAGAGAPTAFSGVAALVLQVS